MLLVYWRVTYKRTVCSTHLFRNHMSPKNHRPKERERESPYPPKGRGGERGEREGPLGRREKGAGLKWGRQPIRG